jgi:hypothetical protein
VFQQSPRAVRHGWDCAAAEVAWNAGDSLVEMDVGAAAPEEIEQVFAKRLVRIPSHRGVLGWVV